jgi:hypothetical protein
LTCSVSEEPLRIRLGKALNEFDQRSPHVLCLVDAERAEGAGVYVEVLVAQARLDLEDVLDEQAVASGLGNLADTETRAQGGRENLVVAGE